MAPVVQPPVRNGSQAGASVYTHSGELAPVVTDLRLPGRGLDLEVVRSYRSSLAGRDGVLGRGWSLNLGRSLDADGADVVYRDGAGLDNRFVPDGQGGYGSPDGLYAVLAEERRGPAVRFRHGIVARFDPPDRGGRLRAIEDRNRNAITIGYPADDRIEVLDTLGRRMELALEDGRVREIRDDAGRAWGYAYDRERRLVEVRRPATPGFPDGTALRYGYDDAHRLAELVDARGQAWLSVRYDDEGRVVEQRHGDGTYRFAYEALGRRGSSGVRTTVGLKNGATLVLEHDAAGHPVTRTLEVRRDAFAPEDVDAAQEPVLLVTASAYNRDGALVSRTEPSGRATTWDYIEDDPDPRNRGNAVRRTESPSPGAHADQPSLVTTWTFDDGFQVPLSVTDPRGNTTTYRYDKRGNRVATAHPPVEIQPVGKAGAHAARQTLELETRYAYNSGGQLIRKTHVDGTVTTFDHYPATDPAGAGGPGTAISDPDAAAGYLAAVTKDAGGVARRTTCRWDAWGNLAEVIDATGNAVRQRFDALGRLVEVRGREPVGGTLTYRYDENGNEVESVQPFDRLEVDDATGATVVRSGTIRELRAYDALDQLVARTIAGGEQRVTERYFRDADGRVVRLVQPTGNVTALEYDERGLVVAMTRGAGTREAVTERRAYTLDGEVRAHLDGNGGRTLHHLDGYGRYLGASDPLGTTLAQQYDAGGNVVRITVSGEDAAPVRIARAALRRDRVALLESAFEYDAWSRPVRIDRAWRGPDGAALGSSGWDDLEGMTSTVFEYGTNGWAMAAWTEGDNVLSIAYDGLGRITGATDRTGERSSFGYDANGNEVSAGYHGPDGDDDAYDLTARRRYDAIDRLVAGGWDEAGGATFRPDALGGLAGTRRASGLELQLLHDELGRRTGQVLVVPDAADEDGARGEQRIVRRFEWDAGWRLTAYVDGAGNRTTYGYDALDRQTSVVYPDGTAATAEYDANGNVVRTRDPAGTETVNRYDAGDRLVERRTRREGGEPVVEGYAYDAVGRLVSASAGDREVRRTYDSRSQLLEEDQGGRIVRATYDAAGRQVALDYPGGESIRRTYDVAGRVVGVATAKGDPIAAVDYRAGGQVRRLVLGGTLEATCAYGRAERLVEVAWRRVADGSDLEGFRYAYDDAGRIVSAVQSSDGSGERFWFDAANRPVRARYGVADVTDPASRFELETTYEHFPEGPWRRRRDVDGNGEVIADRAGTLDERNRYRRFGETSFAYDAAGDTIRKGTDNPGWCLYTYDGQHRLVKVECFDKGANRTQTIDYVYDALGRLVQKTVTDAAGNAVVTTYVWAGNTLLEEYEGVDLVRTYAYSLDTQPARLTVEKNGRTDYLFVHDGRGVAAGLVHQKDPNAFAERYGYEITGGAFVKELDGMPVDLPKRSATASGLLNSIVAGDFEGTLMRDWANGTFAGFGGRQLDPMLASLLSMDASLTGGEHTTLRSTMAKQFNSYLGMLGFGSQNGFVSHGGPGQVGPGGGAKDSISTTGKSSSGGGKRESGASFSGGGSFTPRNFSLYAAGDGGTNLVPSSGQNPAFDFTKGGGGSSGTSGAGGTSSGGLIGAVGKFMDGPGGDVVKGIGAGLAEGAKSQMNGGPPKDSGTGPPKPGESNDAAKRQQEANDKAKKEQADKEKADKEKADKEKADKEKADKEAKEKEEAEKKKKAGSTYVDPDQAGMTAIGPIDPTQIEAKLNGRKRPVNPNTDGGQPQVDTSSPPPHVGGIDPTVAYFDGETYGGLSIEGGGITKLQIAPIDYVRDHEPFTPDGPPVGGGQQGGGQTDSDLDIGHP